MPLLMQVKIDEFLFTWHSRGGRLTQKNYLSIKAYVIIAGCPLIKSSVPVGESGRSGFCHLKDTSSLPARKEGSARRILVTSALPYANGPIHIGHLVEYIQTDIWARMQRMSGNECYYVCADDTHGTPIMLRAAQEGTTPEVLIERVHKEHQADFSDFLIEFDNYYSTNSDENRVLATGIYTRLRDAGMIEPRMIEQAFDPEREMFLPDRYIKGECPRCHATDQYGDACEQCGATYDPTELIDPRSTLSDATPVRRNSEHYFFRLSQCRSFLERWLHGGVAGEPLQEESRNKLEEWFESGLRDWDISRDAPYFGFEIPDAPGKYLYVWLDAPVGYMASFRNFCDRNGLSFDDYWRPEHDTELHHFIGKDILYFHALFWPAMLHHAGYRTPTRIHVHGFLTVNGKKMSKSRGTFIMARTFLDHLNPEYLRYYFAAKLNDRVEDIDLNLEDFVNRVNSDVIGKYINIASRTAGFIHKRFAGRLVDSLPETELAVLAPLQHAHESIRACFERRRYSEAIRLIMDLADQGNAYINEQAPWTLKSESEQARLHAICTTGINLFRLLTIYLKPVMPALAEKVEKFLQVPSLDWADSQVLLLGHEIDRYRHLAKRIEPGDVAKMLEASQSSLPVASSEVAGDSWEPVADTVDIDTFAKIDLRVARIVEAEDIDGSDRLLRLKVDLGGEQRQILAGIKEKYSPSELRGKLTVIIANLQPRKMRFGVSEGMLLAAGPGGQDIWILHPDEGALPGMKIH